MEIFAHRSLESLRVARRKPEGGYCVVSSHIILSAWAAYRQKIIELLDLRVWFACLELLSRRCGAQRGRRPRYRPTEICVLVGNCTERRVRESLRRLERAGLVRWNESALWVARKANDCACLNGASWPIPVRPVPVPRRTVRYLTGLHRPVMIATTVGHLLRGLFLRNGVCVSGGRCKASWIAEVFGVDVRNVKAARRELTRTGWLVAVTSSQMAMNRWGPAFVLSLEWCSERKPVPSHSPPRRAPNTPQLPPLVNKKLLIGSGTQKPDPRGPAGACVGNGSFRAPTFRRIVFSDLEQPARTACLFADAVRLGNVQNTPSDWLLVFAAAAHANSNGVRNPAGLFVWLVRERRWSHINQRDEDRARAALRTMEENRTTSVERWKPVHRKNGSAPAAAHGATPEAARQILAGTGAATYPILAAVSAALRLRGSPQTP